MEKWLTTTIFATLFIASIILCIFVIILTAWAENIWLLLLIIIPIFGITGVTNYISEKLDWDWSTK